jgi:hypothetical protein
MAKYFHVSPNSWSAGAVIEPGHFGKTSLSLADGHITTTPDIHNAPGIAPTTAFMLMREAAVEAARLAGYPNAPSRLRCVFVTATIEDARAFRDRFRPGAQIYELDVSEELPRHFGNFEAITRATKGAPYVASFAEMALSYWNDAPTGAGLMEVLVGGPVTVKGIVE